MDVAKLHFGLSNLKESRDKVPDLNNCDLFSKANVGETFNFIPCVELKLQWEEEGYNRRYITEM